MLILRKLGYLAPSFEFDSGPSDGALLFDSVKFDAESTSFEEIEPSGPLDQLWEVQIRLIVLYCLGVRVLKQKV